MANDASIEDADKALDQAVRAFPEWRDEDPARRSMILMEAASRMRLRRDELSGIIIRESGKVWREADADVCEAIDFCEYYAREAMGLFEHPALGVSLENTTPSSTSQEAWPSSSAHGTSHWPSHAA